MSRKTFILLTGMLLILCSSMFAEQMNFSCLESTNIVWDGGSVRFGFKVNGESKCYLLALHRNGKLKDSEQKIFISNTENLKEKREIIAKSDLEIKLIKELTELAKKETSSNNKNLNLLISLIKDRTLPWPKPDEWYLGR